MTEQSEKICPKCKREVVKDVSGNWFVNGFGILMSHNIECDNKYLEEESK